MALRRPLSVAACTVALLCSTLLAAVPAQAGTAQAGTALAPITQAGRTQAPAFSGAATALPASPSLPGADEIKAAKKDPTALKAMVAQVESLIATSTQELLEAEAAALEDQDSYTAASEALAERTAAATEARTQAGRAAEYYDAAKAQVGQIAGDLYRNGGIAPGVSALFESTENNDVLYKASTMEALATNRSQTFSTAQQAAALWAEWETYAAQTEAAAAEAAGVSRSAQEDAARTQAVYAERLSAQEEVRDTLIGQLAVLRDSSVAEEERRIAAKEAAARETALAAALAAAPATPAATAPAAQAAAPKAPAEVPDVAPAASVLVPGTPNKETTADPAPAAVAAPSTKAPSTQNPAAKPATPSAAPATKAPTTKAPTAASSAAPTKSAAPKETESAQEAGQASNPLPATSSGIVEPAIKWALATAADNSIGYKYGGNGPDLYDCSAFSRSAFGKGGLSLSRTSTQQYFAAPHKIPLSELKRGDLVFWSSNGGASFYHVAIYLGNGQIVHARNPSTGISVTALNYAGMYNIYPYAGRY